MLYSVDDIFPTDDEEHTSNQEEGTNNVEFRHGTEMSNMGEGNGEEERDSKFYESEYDDVSKDNMRSFQTLQVLKTLKFRTSLLWVVSALCGILVGLLIIFIVLYARESWTTKHPVRQATSSNELLSTSSTRSSDTVAPHAIKTTPEPSTSTTQPLDSRDNYCTSADCVIIASRMLETMMTQSALVQ